LEALRSFAVADVLLRQFSGLRVGSTGGGRECATSDIEFYTEPSSDHRYAVAKLEADGSDLFPLGQAQHEDIDIFVDASGQGFAYMVPNGKLKRVGKSFSDAVERLLLGLKLDYQPRGS
jgi:hypothetical protein